MSETFFQRKERELGIVLNTVQQQAVMKTEGPLLVLACPGSGKTTTMMMRIGYLIEEKKIAAQHIIAISFSKASAQDMEKRYKKLFPSSPTVKFSTIHSLAFSIARTYLDKNRITFDLIEGKNPQQQMTKLTLLKRIYKEVLQDDCPDDELKALSTFISSLKNKMLIRENWKNCKGPVRKAGEIAEKYEQFKNRTPHHILLDFDDMLTIAEKALAEDEQLCHQIQETYHYVLTDESQDTSYVQHKIIEHMTSLTGNVCVVADDDQSIYTWRGAEPEYLLNFKQAYPEATILMMERNYRSTSSIVGVSAKFIERNANRYPKKMYTENELGKAIHLKSFATRDDQVDYVIYELLAEQDVSDIAILFRNNVSSMMFVSELHRRAIPFYMKDADDQFFSHWIVEDILNFMRLSFNMERKDIFAKICMKMNAYISKGMVAKFIASSKTGNVFDVFMETNVLRERQVKQLIAYKKRYVEIGTMRPVQVIQEIRKNLGYEEGLKSRAEKFGFRFENLVGILNTLEDIATPLRTMVEFAKQLKQLEQAVKEAKFSPSQNAVTLSTLHSAKGLEFRKVFMIDLQQGIIPSEEDETDAALLEESRRLFYVGMTRAKTTLELLSYQKENDKSSRESQFIREVRSIIHPETAQGHKRITSQQLVKKIAINENGIAQKDELTVGLIVQHRVFGSGKILAIDHERVTIQFEKVEKELDISTILQYLLLEKVD